MIGGVLYRPVVGSSVSFPAGYEGNYFFSDYYDGFMWRIRKNGSVWERQPTAGQPNATDWARGYGEVTDYVEGPDGAIYYARMAYGYQAGTGQIRRITFNSHGTGVPMLDRGDVRFAPPTPSPARGAATLTYALARGANVRLTLYDAMGRLVRRLVPATAQPAGEYPREVEWRHRGRTARTRGRLRRAARRRRPPARSAGSAAAIARRGAPPSVRERRDEHERHHRNDGQARRREAPLRPQRNEHRRRHDHEEQRQPARAERRARRGREAVPRGRRGSNARSDGEA